jgi:hypothetical protein
MGDGSDSKGYIDDRGLEVMGSETALAARRNGSDCQPAVMMRGLAEATRCY